MVENEVVLRQKNVNGFDVQIKLVNGRELKISRKNRKTNQSYSVDILSLTNKSKKTFFIAWKWLFSSIGFIAILLLSFKLLPFYLVVNKDMYLSAILLTCILGSSFCIIFFWKKTSRFLVFYSRGLHVPIITLKIGQPSKELFSSFVSIVEKRILKFSNHMDIDKDKQLTGEMKMLRRLSDVGVINKKDYEKYKAKLLQRY